MVQKLVKDALWRNRWAYAIYGPIQLPFWLLFDGRINSLPISVAAFSMIAAAMLGPMFAASAMGLRELRHLPVTTRDVWRATWFIATVVPVGMLMTTKTIAFFLVTAYGGRTEISAEGTLISVALDFIWASVVLLMFPLIGYAGQYGARHGAVMSSLAGAASIAGILAGFAAPLLISDALPARVGEFTPITTGLLIVGIAIAVGAIAWTPTRGQFAGERPQVLTKRGRVRSDAVTRPRFVDRLTGISRVAVPHLASTFTLAIVGFAGLAAYGLISGSGPWWFVPPSLEVLSRDDDTWDYFVLMPCIVTVMLGAWTPWARLLKVLPLSAIQINALLVITPFATWTILWILGWSVYSLAYGPLSPRIGFAFGMASFTALVQAAMLRFQGSRGTILVMMAIGGLMSPVGKAGLSDEFGYQIVFAALVAIALGAAVFINHYTLTRSTSSSRAYRPPQPPFGVSPATQIR